MTREEFEKKMATIPVEEPDEVDLAMLEEADSLFHDDRNVDDVANIIQNRANIYISEKK